MTAKTKAFSNRLNVYFSSKKALIIGVSLGLIVSIILANQVFTVTWLVSDSMAPTLNSDLSPFWADWVLIEELSIKWYEPERGELVFFETYDELLQEDVQVIKRVAGLPGEEIEIKRGALFVNGEKTKDISEDIQKRYTNGGAFGMRQKLKILPENYMVLGDNSEVSLDSRYYGALRKNNLKGIGLLRIWPLWRIGVL